MSTIVTRAGKGSPLTNTEVDANFTSLNTDKLELGIAQANGTPSGVLYLNDAKAVTAGSALAFDGTNFSCTGYVHGRSGGTAGVAFRIGDDSTLQDINESNTIGVYGVQDATTGSLKLGSSGPTLTGSSAGLTVNTRMSIGNDLTVKSPNGVEGGQINLNNRANTAAAYVLDVDAGDHGRLFTTQNNTNLLLGQLVGTGGAVAVYTAGTERMRIDSSGNVGIGVTPIPSTTSKVQSNADIVLSGTNRALMLNMYYASGWKYAGNGYALVIKSDDTSGGGLSVEQAPLNSSGAGAAATPVSVMKFNASGGLGLGVAAGSHKFVSSHANTTNFSGNYFVSSNAAANDAAGLVRIATSNTTPTNLLINCVNSVGSVFQVASDNTLSAYNLRPMDASANGTLSLGFNSGNGPSMIAWGSGTAGAGMLEFYTAGTSKLKLDTAGRLGLGIAPTSATGIYQNQLATGATVYYGFLNTQVAQSDVTTGIEVFRSHLHTQAASFTMANAGHFSAGQGTFGAGSVITNQYGFQAQSSLVGATNNFGFKSDIPAGTGRWNFYAAGTAPNYFAGNVGIGTTGGDYDRAFRMVARQDQNATTQIGVVNATVGANAVTQITKIGGTGNSYVDWFLADANGSPTDTFRYGTAVGSVRWELGGAERMRIDSSGNVGIGGAPSVGVTIDIQKALTGASNAFSISARINPDSTVSSAYGFGTYAINVSGNSTPTIYHFHANQGTYSGTAPTNQYGFVAQSSLISGTNNYGFYSNIASGTGRWNFYSAGTAKNYMAGTLQIGTISATTDGQDLLSVRGNNAGGVVRAQVVNPNTTANTQARYDLATGTANAYVLSSVVETGAGAANHYVQCGTGITASYSDFEIHAFRNRAGTEKLRFDATGKVLIGLSTSKSYGGVIQAQRDLDVISTGATTSAMVRLSNYNALDASPTYAALNLFKYDASFAGNTYTTGQAAANQAEIAAINSGGLHIGTNTGNPIVFGTSGTERMRIAADGSIGIGRAPVGFEHELYRATGLVHSSVTSGGTTVTDIAQINATGGAFASNITQYGSGTAYFQSNATAMVVGTTGSAGLYFQTGAALKASLLLDGTFEITTAARLGYGTGAGGTVTQSTSKSTAVTLNKPTGQITMNNAALAAGAAVTFICNNSLMSINDCAIATLKAGSIASAEAYTLTTTANNGIIYFSLANRSTGSLSEAVVINFAIIKGSAS